MKIIEHKPYLTGVPEVDKYLIIIEPFHLLEHPLELPTYWYKYLTKHLKKEQFQNVIAHYYPITYQAALDQYSYDHTGESFTDHLCAGNKANIENEAVSFTRALIKMGVWIPEITDYLTSVNPFLPTLEEDLLATLKEVISNKK